MNKQTLAYRGIIKGIVSAGSRAVFITTHLEGQSTALYRLDAKQQKMTLTLDALPCGATALVSNQKKIWFAGDDGRLYSSAFTKGKPIALPALSFADAPVMGLALLEKNRLAVLQKRQLSLIDLKNNAILQSISYTESTHVMDVSADGLWLALGNSKGEVSVYQTDEDSALVTLSDCATLHKGAVTALKFEADALRFYSAGADKKLFSTHAQGNLQPLDRGKSSNHNSNIHAIHLGKTRFFTGAGDKSLKAWPYGGGQPVSLKKGLANSHALVAIEYQDMPCLLSVGRDETLRFIGLTTDETFTEVRAVIRDGYTGAKQTLQKKIASERETAIAFLAGYDDKKSLTIIANHYRLEKDKAVCEKMVALVSRSTHKESTPLLEGILTMSRYDTLRLNAFTALLTRAENGDLSPYEKALACGYVGVGAEALKRLGKRAKKEPRAEQLLVKSLRHKHPSLRLLTLNLLESVYPKKSPKASLDALKTAFSDLQGAALIRLFQRGLLDNIEVKRAILLAQDQDDDQVRHTALLVSILSRKELSKALKTREENFARQLQELEAFDLLATEEKANNTTLKTVKKIIKEAVKKVAKPSPLSKLTHDDYAVLLQSMTSRHDNICFNAAYALAVLQDQRAFGVLVSLAQQYDSSFQRGVCQALGVLGQQDAIPSLEILLNHARWEVREAAFNALDSLDATPFITAQRGLQSKHKDIHARSLKTLLDVLKKRLKKADKVSALTLLKAALNDQFEEIRQETCKACLNQQLGGNAADTLRLLLESQFSNIHQEVLNELMEKASILPVLDWVEPLVFELFNNDFERVRVSAFKFALKEKKRFENGAVLAMAVSSVHADVRFAVLKHIQRHNTKKKQLHLQRLLNDSDDALREQAIELIVLLKNEAAIVTALNSPYDAVRVVAATALAQQGDQRAYAVFDALLSMESPNKKQDKIHWHTMVCRALQGLRVLADPCGLDHVMRYLKQSDKTLVKYAAEALPWVTTQAHSELLQTLQRDERNNVRVLASFSLALLGDASAKLTTDHAKLMDDHLSSHEQLAVVLSLNKVTPITLQTLLCRSNTTISATLALVSYELLKHPTAPKLTAWALTIDDAKVQHFCAGLMTCYSDEVDRWTYVKAWLVDHFSDDKWTMSVATLKEIAAILVYGDGHTKMQLLYVLRSLDGLVSITVWQLRYRAFSLRYADAITQASQQVVATDAIKPLQQEWNQRAFGTYLALVQQVYRQGSYDGLQTSLKALHRLHSLAEADAQLHPSVCSCFLTLLNHQMQDIRQFAFDDLQRLGMDLGELGHVATTSPQQDIAKQGLALLVAHTSLSTSHSLLQSLIQGDDAVLSSEAFVLYRDDKGLVDAAHYALQSYNMSLRYQCVTELAAQVKGSESSKESKTQALLVKAVHNDNASVAIKAATHLARQSHTEALALLSELLKHNKDEQQQKRIIHALKLLPDARVAESLFDYLRHNKNNRQEAVYLYKMLADYRHRPLFDALLTRLVSHSHEITGIAHALILITGYDQPFEDFYERKDDRRWIDKQHPRHDALLVRLFTTMIKLERHDMAANLVPVMSWPKGKAISKTTDHALHVAIPVIDPHYLEAVVKTLSYRLKRRGSHADTLLQLLTHTEPTIQLFAAEALALNGRHQGFAILLAAIDYQENDTYRQRAVLALGKSGDQRAIDKLLALAKDKEHVLNEVAIEAIGSMGESEQAEAIFKLLKSSLQRAGYYSDMNQHALNGLRCFNTLSAWQLICEYIENRQHCYSDREYAVNLLQHWDTNASRTLLLALLQHETDDDVVKTAYHVAQRLWKTADHQTSAVDYALLQGHYPEIDKKAVERITLYAPTATLLALLVADYAEEETTELEAILAALHQGVLTRDDYTANDIGKALESNNTRLINAVASLLTRKRTLTKAVKAHLQTALVRYFQHWEQAYDECFKTPVQTTEREHILAQTTQALQALLWALVKHGEVNDIILLLLSAPKKEQQPFQLSILKSLLSVETRLNKAVLKPLEMLLDSSSVVVSHLANQLLQAHGKGKGIDWRHFQGQPHIVLEKQFNQTVVQAVSTPAQQAQALPILIAKQDSETLLMIASDEQQQETVRIGAIEGLGCILEEGARHALNTLHQNSDDNDMSKAAYRALRRQQRRQIKADQCTAPTGV